MNAMTDARYAYHEAGHIVVAAVFNIPMRSVGVGIDEDGLGSSELKRPPRSVVSQKGSSLENQQRSMVVVLAAGLLAQKSAFPDSTDKSAACDEKQIEQYLSALGGRWSVECLRLEARGLVEEHRAAIAALAKELWNKCPTPRTFDWGSSRVHERRLSATEVRGILSTLGIPLAIDDSSEETGIVVAE